MPKQKHTLVSTTLTWKDTVNNNAEWDTSWDTNEAAIVAISSFNLPYDNASCTIEDIQFTGTGTVPTAVANINEIQVIVATDTSFSNIIAYGTGTMSHVKIGSTCIASFPLKRPIRVSSTDSLYISVLCGTGAALTGTAGVITISQE